MTTRKLVGHLRLDSGQILLLDPVRLGSKAEYQRVVEVTLRSGAGEVWLRDEEPKTTNDGVVVETASDGVFPVFVEYGVDGVATTIHVDLA